MKLTIKRICLLITLVGILAITGCDKVKFGTYNASDEDAGSVQISENVQKNNESKEKSKTGETDSKTEAKAEKNKTDKKKSENDKNDEKVSAVDEEDKNPDNNPTQAPSQIQPNPTKDLPVYTVNSTTAEIEPVTALIPEDTKITARLIVDTVVESLADQSIIIKIDSVTTEDDKVIVSFKKDKAPYSDLGSGYEAAILDAIAQSLVDNLSGYNKVIYRIENQPYVSGVFEYGIDEPHLG